MTSIRTYHKKREYVAPSTYGAYTPGSLSRSLQGVRTSGPNFPRPYPYFSFLTRLQQAWDVFKYRADALYWKEPSKKTTHEQN